MKFKIAQGFIIQATNDDGKVLGSTFIPSDKMCIDSETFNISYKTPTSVENIKLNIVIDESEEEEKKEKKKVNMFDPSTYKGPVVSLPSDPYKKLKSNMKQVADQMFDRDWKIPFGKHKNAGLTLKELPKDYLQWGVKELTNETTKAIFQKELDYRFTNKIDAVIVKSEPEPVISNISKNDEDDDIPF